MRIKKGDYGFVIPARIIKADSTVFNLTGYTVKLKVWTAGSPTPTWTLDGTVTDAAAGKVEFTVENTHFTETGSFIGEIELTQAGHVESTISFRVIVVESA